MIGSPLRIWNNLSLILCGPQYQTWLWTRFKPLWIQKTIIRWTKYFLSIIQFSLILLHHGYVLFELWALRKALLIELAICDPTIQTHTFPWRYIDICMLVCHFTWVTSATDKILKIILCRLFELKQLICMLLILKELLWEQFILHILCLQELQV